MTKILNLDEMLEVLRGTDKESAARFERALVAIGTKMAEEICAALNLKAGQVTSEGSMLGGTACAFFLTSPDQPTPKAMVGLDVGEPLEYP